MTRKKHRTITRDAQMFLGVGQFRSRCPNTRIADDEFSAECAALYGDAEWAEELAIVRQTDQSRSRYRNPRHQFKS